MSGPIISPWDRHNQELAANVHPPDWVNPEPSGRYNLVVVGAGTAGLVTAAGAAGLGARVALVERHLMGGDCLNVGCVPSKTLLRSARAAAEVRAAAEFGVMVGGEGVVVDFAGVMERVRALRAGISKHDSAKRFRDLGVDVFLGAGKFLDGETVEVSGKKLRFKRAVIATGGRAAQPKIDGLAEAGFLTNETVFSLTEQPARLAVIGGGPIGCELAQGFARLGSRVTLLHKNEHLLDREDAEAAALIQKQFSREQIEVVTGADIVRASKSAGGKTLYFRSALGTVEVTVDEILVAAGRAPNIEGLNLEAAGVAGDPREGILVNDYLQTSNRRIYAAGDVCMKWKFTHAADAAARVVIQNALFIKSRRVSTLLMPWCTYTDPEVAHVGLYEREATDQGFKVATYTQPLSGVDRAVTDGEENGFVKIHVRRDTNHILGATIVARHAGEMISEISVAMAGRLQLTDLGNVIHPYPTQAEAIRKCADACNRARLTPGVKGMLSRWLRWRRRF
jgi:pyruvate/2-oxoglutarate dehydrogenase complex dihydrolipoamide dehydrogenase (E3) component